MRTLVFVCSLVACGVAAAETHIGFEAALHPSIVNPGTTIVRLERFYATGKARASGFVHGDMIVWVDKVRVKHPKTIANYCKRKKPGELVVVTVKRNDSLEGIVVELVEGDEMRKDGLLDR
jgi:hypothetical protein